VQKTPLPMALSALVLPVRRRLLAWFSGSLNTHWTEN